MIEPVSCEHPLNAKQSHSIPKTTKIILFLSFSKVLRSMLQELRWPESCTVAWPAEPILNVHATQGAHYGEVHPDPSMKILNRHWGKRQHRKGQKLFSEIAPRNVPTCLPVLLLKMSASTGFTRPACLKTKEIRDPSSATNQSKDGTASEETSSSKLNVCPSCSVGSFLCLAMKAWWQVEWMASDATLLELSLNFRGLHTPPPKYSSCFEGVSMY